MNNSDIPFTPFKARRTRSYFLAVEGVNPGTNQRIEVNRHQSVVGALFIRARSASKPRRKVNTEPLYFSMVCV